MFIKSTIICILLTVFTAFVPVNRVEQMQLNVTIQTLTKGEVITVKGNVYYRVANGLMVTRFTYPREIITITNAQGELKNYNVKDNSVMQLQGADFSSKQSFLYNFLSGRHLDMGLKEIGFSMTSSKIEDGLVVSKWNAPIMETSLGNTSIELVHENRLPIYMGVFIKDSLISKTYYTNYQNINEIRIPFNITEISYINGKKDSLVTRKKYSNVLLNSPVDPTYLEFEIPANAVLLNNEAGLRK